MLGGVVKRQDSAHREAAHDDRTAMLAQSVVLLFDALVPLLPGRRLQLLGALAMAGELRDVHRVAGTGETLSDEAQLYRRNAEPVDKKEAPRPSGKAKTFILDLHPTLRLRTHSQTALDMPHQLFAHSGKTLSAHPPR